MVFTGNETISSDDLTQAMILREGSEYDSFLLGKDAESIVELYGERGFPEAEVVEKRVIPHGDGVLCELLIVEGERIKITGIQVIGNVVISTSEIEETLGFKRGTPYDPDVVYAGRYRVKSLYATRGHLYASVRTNIVREDPTVQVIVAIEEGPEVTVGAIRIEGNFFTRRRIIEREIVVKPGDVYDPDDVYKSQEKLYGTDLFRDVDFEVLGVKDSSEVVDLLFRVEEVSPRWVSFGLGYQSPDRLLANVRLGHDNLFNNGQKFSISTFLSYSLEEEHEEDFEVEYLEPYLMSTRFGLSVRLFHNREKWVSYSQQETGANARIGRYITERLRFFVQYQYKTVHIDTLEGTAEGITNSILFSLSRDTRDDFFNPLRGTYASLVLETAGGFLGGSNDFGRSIFDLSGFVNPIDRVVLGARLKYGELRPFGESEEKGVSLNERFELGGGASVRGYDEASIGPADARKKSSGYVMINPNLEVRCPVYGKLWAGFFVDSGGVWMNRSDIDLSDFVLSAGVGIRYSLPIGPLRLDYARKLTNPSPGELGRLYLAIGHIF